MNQRPGLSLSEVLIAIFVIAIGLMGVLSLFPLGAVRMAQAIKDDRTAIHNLNVGANMRWMWKEDGFTTTGAQKRMYERNRTNPQPGAPPVQPFDYHDAFV